MTLDLNIIMPSLFVLIGALAATYVKYQELRKSNKELLKEKKDTEIKLAIFDKVIDLEHLNSMYLAVKEIYKYTTADRFLIFIAVNGKDRFNVVSVIFEQHKEEKYIINATARYKGVRIDNCYRDMLESIKKDKDGFYLINSKLMPDQILKDFYTIEGVHHSAVKFLTKKAMDSDNDILVYCSIAKHTEFPYEGHEISFIKTQIEGTITPNLIKVLDLDE